MKKFITVKTRFSGVHHWPNIPDDHPMQFLKNPHRHEFHVEATWVVSHDNRELEFLAMKERLNYLLYQTKKVAYGYWGSTDDTLDLESKSCETIATLILNHLNCYMVKVSEDGENTATVIR